MTDQYVTTNPGIAQALARWAATTVPGQEDLALTDRSLLDTVAVALAARTHEIRPVVDALDGRAARWAALAHVIDFDDLHLPSTTHISTVCVPVALATAGDDPGLAARAYLAGAGVMARVGAALGWSHYTAGWHATTTSGAIASAVVAGVALDLTEEQLTHAIALAVPASGGVQRAFGTDAKSLQVGLAAQAGVQAARLAATGATADPRAVEAWMHLLGGDPTHPLVTSPSSDPAMIPGGLAIKVYPACYALQRPIGALRETVGGPVTAQEVTGIRLTTPAGTVTPLVHHRPQTGLEGKFSLEYAAATALLDPHSGFWSFKDEAVQRADAQRLVELTEITLTGETGDGLLLGSVDVEVDLADGRTLTGSLDLPPGSPGKPPTDAEMVAKVTDCLALGGIEGLTPADITWATGAHLLTTHLAPTAAAGHSAYAPEPPHDAQEDQQNHYEKTWRGRKTTTKIVGTEEEVEIVRLVREFVTEQVKPVVQELEHANTYPEDLIEAMKNMGIFGLAIPEPWGQAQVSLPAYCLVTEELARGWMSLAGAMGGHTVVAKLILAYGTAEQKDSYLPRMATGQLRATMALTEPGGGSDLQAMRTTAKVDGEDYVVNGSKTWITNARKAGLIALMVKTDPEAEPRHKGVSILLVEKDPDAGREGFHLSRDLPKLGYKGVESCELAFDHMRVPRTALLGEVEGQGFAQMMKGLEVGRLQVASRALGVGRAALEDSLQYAQEREAFGVPIWKHQSIGNYLAEMATKLVAARQLTLHAARAFDAGQRADMEAGMAKLFASEVGMEIALDAIRIHGGYGYSTEFDVERYFRDAPLMIVGEGTNEIQKNVIARQLIKRGNVDPV